jgi:hypothetical protein
MAGAEILKIFGLFVIRKSCQIRNDDIGLLFTFLVILWEDLLIDIFHIYKKSMKENIQNYKYCLPIEAGSAHSEFSFHLFL